MKNHFSKRLLAFFIALCFVFGQSNLPAGLFKLNLGTILNTKAAGETWSEKLPVQYALDSASYDVTFKFTVINGTNVALTGTVSEEFDAVGSAAFSIPETVLHNGTTYTITAIGLANQTSSDSQDNLAGLTNLKEVTIPKTITTIAANAFLNDTALCVITFAEGSQLESIGSNAFSGCFNISGAKYSLTLPDTLTSIGNSAFYNCRYLTTVTCQSADSNPVNLTLGESAFYGNSSLTSIVLPDTTVSIGASCFYNCNKLATLNLPSSLTAFETKTFYNCSELWKDAGTVTFPASIKRLESQAFYGCTSITSINLSNTQLETIGEEAFYNCNSLSGDPGFNDNLKVISKKAFCQCTNLGHVDDQYGISLTFPAKLTTIGESAFEQCQSFTGINWSNAPVQSLGKSAFTNCTSISYLTIPNGLASIPESLCVGCSKLGRIDIPVSVTSIGNNAFQNCNSLTNIFYYSTSVDSADENNSNFRASQLESIGTYAFAGSGLSSFYLPSKVSVIKDFTFSECKNLDVVRFHDNLTYIGNSAFSNCSVLGKNDEANKSLTIPATVSTLGGSAFNGCKTLESITLESTKITTLNASTFSNCTNLKTVTLPDSITVLENSAFQNDSSLATINMPSFNSITRIGNNCFNGCSNFSGFNADTGGAITFPATLSSLGGGAFKNCSLITSIDLSATTVPAISSNTFSGTKLNIIKFSKKLTSIAEDSFVGCALNAMSFQTTKVPTVNTLAFKNADGTQKYIDDSEIKISVPAISKSDYIELFTKLGFNIPESNFQDSIVNADSITISSSTKTTYIGGTIQTKVEQNGGTEPIIYKSSNPKVADVNGQGIITGTGIGTATITATTDQSKQTASLTINVIADSHAQDYVKDPIVSISTEPSQLNAQSTPIYAGDSVTIYTSPGYSTSGGDDTKEPDKILWTLPQVDPSHPLTGPITNPDGSTTISNGYVTITYTQESATIKAEEYYKGTINAICSSSCSQTTVPISMSALLNSLTAKKPSVTMDFTSTPVELSQYFSLAPSNSSESVTYESNNPGIATVDAAGKLTCVSTGTVVITARSSKSNLSAQMTLTIQNNVTSMSVADNKTSYTVLAGQSFSFNATALYSNQNVASNDIITWSSNNENVAKVTSTQNGNNYTVTVQTTAKGSTTIQAKNSSNRSLLSISVSATGISLEKSSLTAYTKGPNKKVTIKITNELPSGVTATYAMADAKFKKVASVSASGVVTAKKAGKATVNVTVLGQTTKCNITVIKGVLKVGISGASLKKSTFTISKSKKKASITVSPNFLLSTKKKVTYKSSKKSVATVSKKGVLKLKKKGKTKLTVTCNKVKVTYTLKVK